MKEDLIMINKNGTWELQGPRASMWLVWSGFIEPSYIPMVMSTSIKLDLLWRDCDTLYPTHTHIYTNNKKNRNVELIKSFKTHLYKIISKG